MISVVYVTFNESDKLRKSLESIQDLASEIVVVNLGSEDDLLTITQDFKVKVFTHQAVPFVELVRAYAISKATSRWVLVLDPDEIIPEKLKLKLKELIKDDLLAAINIPRKNVFFGKWIRHSNFWPDRQIRCFQKELVEWPKRIHVYPKITGEVIDLPADPQLAIIHYGYDKFSDFWQRQQRYSTVEAGNLYQEGRRFSILGLFWAPIRIFLVRFIKHRGFLDGIEGLLLIFGLMYFSLIIQLKLLRLGRKS